MAIMASGVYDALRSANVPEDKARIAAEEVVSRDRDIADVKSDLAVLKWMVGTVAALQLGTIGSIVAYALNHATFR